jgi:pyruvate dehydrogenase (quinone)
VKAAADVLNAGKKTVILAGQGALGATDELEQLADLDSGTITTWAARHIQMKRGQMFSCSGNLATMASGLPYAIAAQVAYPRRQSVAFVGDGGFSMLMGEFAPL